MKTVLLLAILATSLFADIFQMNKKLGHTLNLGNYLEAPNEGDWGALLTEDDFVRIAEKGFTAVRIPVRWNNHLNPDTTIDTTFMNRVIWAVENANNNGLTAIIDDHHFEGLMSDPDANEPVIKRFWNEIAETFKNIPDDALFFEPVNEPHTNLTAERWNSLFADLVSIIRQTNPTRPIIAGTTGWGGVSGLFALELPEDNNIIATVHYYSPFEFTHQGAEWVENSEPWLGTTWEGDYFQKKAVLDDMTAVKEWSDNNGVPVFVGEFGAYNKADLESRLHWTHYAARLFESLDLSWAYWEYSSGFGLFDLSKKEWNQALVDTLLSTDTKTLTLDSSSVSYGEELVQNGTFSEGTADWNHSVWGDGAEATFTSDNSSATHSVISAGADFYQIQLLQSGISLEANKSYLLRVVLSGDDTAMVGLGMMRSDYSSVAGGNATVIPSKEISLELSIEPTQDESNLTLVLNLGYQPGTISIKSISLREFSTGTVPVTLKNRSISKASMSFFNNEIRFSQAFPINSVVNVFSIRGREVFRGEINEERVLSLPGTMSKGWYGITVHAQGQELFRQSFLR